jgi:hypothetical protein
VAYFNFFHFLLLVWQFFFQISKSIFSVFFHFPLLVWQFFFKFQNQIFSFFSISLSGGMANFFQYSKTKCFNSNFKNEIVFISNFPYGINDFFLTTSLPNVFKNWKITITLTKNSPRIAYHHWSTVKKSPKTKDVPKQKNLICWDHVTKNNEKLLYISYYLLNTVLVSINIPNCTCFFSLVMKLIAGYKSISETLLVFPAAWHFL